MECKSMGRVTVEVEVENLEDSWEARRGLRPADQVRRITVSDALVDTGATTLSLPSQIIQQLGLARQSERQVITSTGKSQAAVYTAVRLTILGRSCTVDVMEVPHDVPALVGQVPLELLDFVVDPVGQRLIGNPAHGGQHVVEMLLARNLECGDLSPLSNVATTIRQKSLRINSAVTGSANV